MSNRWQELIERVEKLEGEVAELRELFDSEELPAAPAPKPRPASTTTKKTN